MNPKAFPMLKMLSTGVLLMVLTALTHPSKRVDTDALGGEDRFLVHVFCDKPIYKEQDNVMVRVVTLDAFTRAPKSVHGMYGLKIIGPRGDQVDEMNLGVWGRGKEQGSLGFKWTVPAGTAGGVYTARVEVKGAEVIGEREFEIRAWRPPRLKTEITFARDGYGPGDRVSALCSVIRAEGGIPRGAAVDVVARVDGYEIHRETVAVDEDGFCVTQFVLPAQMEEGLGTLSFVIQDGGRRETASKSLPILMQNLDLQFYPEGGDLVAGLENRVYVEARQPNGKPADLRGRIVDASGATAALFETEHEGRGAFQFTPRAGVAYRLEIDEPAGMSRRFPLPAAVSDGAVLRALPVNEDRALQLELGSDRDREVLVVITQREREAARQRVRLTRGGFETITIEPPATFDGVLIATVYDDHDKPLAERLVFRRPEHRLDVKIQTEATTYVPGEKVTLKVTVTDDAGKPVVGNLGVTVTDSAVLEALETRERAPGLEVAALLEAEVRELRDVGAYLDPDDPKAEVYLDLLLATQGWRRFGFLEWESFVEAHDQKAKRAAAYRIFTETVEWEIGIPEVRRRNAPVQFAPAPMVADGPPVPVAEQAEGAAVQVQNVAEAPEKKNEVLPAAPRPEPPNPEVIVADELVIEPNFADDGFAKMDLEVLPKRRVGAPFRIYAHQARPNRQAGDRKDFTETLYWSAGLRTDENGEAEISFDLSDQVTAFAVKVDAWSDKGILGTAYEEIRSVPAFYVEPGLPLEISTLDKVQVPVAVSLKADRKTSVELTLSGAGDLVTRKTEVSSKSGGAVRMPLAFPDQPGEHTIVVDAKAGNLTDRVTRRIRVAPYGFPVDFNHGGQMDAAGESSFVLTVPDNTVHVETHAEFFPTPLANMTSALQRLIREPYGCFEQTSSVSYPLVMAQQYFQSHHGVDPALVRDASAKLKTSYDRLTSFECKSLGYEWFGGDPGHEALTAYGLMQFKDMAGVQAVDPGMIKRTRDWLMSRRDGKGGFKRNQKALDSFGGAPEDTTNAYIVWALVTAGERDLKPELDHLAKIANVSKDSYILALAANALHEVGREEEAVKIMAALAKHQREDGAVMGAEASITRAYGGGLTIETTALAALAWLRDPGHAAHAHKAVTWLFESCQGGMFGSTQGTILALKAIIAYDVQAAATAKPGAVTLWVDGQPVGDPVAFDADRKEKIVLPDFSHVLRPGKTHRIQLKMTDGSRMPFAVEIRAMTPQPDSAEACRLELQVGLSDRAVDAGEVTEVNVVVTNKVDELLPTPVAIIGLPGGVEPRHDQLKELVGAGTIDAYEIRGREVICYWRALPKKGRVSFPISVTAKYPGSYTAPASRAYEYYSAQNKIWSPGVVVEIR